MQPGKIGLKEKGDKGATVSYHFPVDAHEILQMNPGKYEIVEDGSPEAGRLNIEALRNSENVAVITGLSSDEVVETAPAVEAAPAKAEAPKADKPAAK